MNRSFRFALLFGWFVLFVGARAHGGARPGAAADEDSAIKSSSIAVSGSILVTTNPDSRSLTVVDLNANEVLREIEVGANPQTVFVDGSVAWVALIDEDAVAEVDLVTGSVIARANVGDEPFGILGRDGRVYVSCSGSNEIVVLDRDNGSVLRKIDVEDRPRGLAIDRDGRFLWISHFQNGEISVVDLVSLEVATIITTGPDSNLSQAIVLDEDRGYAWLPQTRSNATNQALLFDTTLFPIVSAVKIGERVNDVRERIALDVADRPVNMPFDAALTSDGRLFVVHAGSDDVSVIDLESGMSLAHIEVGPNPRGIALSPDESYAFTNDTLGGTVSVIDTDTYTVVDTIEVTTIPLPPDVLNGKILFHNSSRRELANDQWISCGACHFEGGMDGRTWFFRDGPRNTTSLLGSGETGPWHWSGDLDELQDVENTVRVIQAGTGLAAGPAHCEPACDQAPPNSGRSQDLDDLAAFMRFLGFSTPNPNLEPDGSLTEAAMRGRAIFFTPRVGCAECHPPPFFTDRSKHDVGSGTGPFEQKGTEFDTPSLRGIYKTAPYLHDGSAATLEEVLTTSNPDDLHGETTALTADEISDLIAFLRSLPYAERRTRSVRRP